MSTISGLLLNYPQLRPYDDASATINAINAAGGITRGQTALLELADLKRQQDAQAAARTYLQQHPGALLGEQPLSTLGSLQGPGGGPPVAPGPLTQQAFAPGQPAGAPQVVPGGQDLSQFATGQPPPQSTLGALGAQAPRNPLLDLARQNPDAAAAVVDRQQKLAEQRLSWQGKIAGYLGSVLQGVNSQESYDMARREVQRVSPEWANALPATYSKEGLQPFIDRALSVKDKALLDAENLKTQAEVFKTRVAAAGQQIVPKYTGDAQRDSLMHSEMQRRGLTGNPPQDVLDRVEQRIQQGKVDVSASQGAGQAQQAGQAAYNKERMTQAANMGSSAQSSLSTLNQMQTLMDEGVYGNSWGDVFNMGLYQARLNQGDQQAVRTQQLRDYGNQLIRDVAEGKLGAGVSNRDVDIFRNAVGNFQKAKNLDEMRESLAQMQGAAKRMIGQANRMQQTFQGGGRLPDFGDESHVQSVSRKDFDTFVQKHPEKTRDQWRRQFTADGLVFRE